MDNRKFQSASSASPPAVEAAPSTGYPTDGNPSTATPATIPGARWFHQIGEELRNVIASAGLTPSDSDLTQLLQALPGALASRPEMARSLAANGYQKLPGGLIIQWGDGTSTAGYLAVTFPVAFPVAARCVLGIHSGSGNATVIITAISATGCTLGIGSVGALGEAPSGVFDLYWLAIGY